jgi:cation diffusion facilitator family transporter
VAASPGTKRSVYAALAGNVLIAVSKFIAAAITGSSAMVSEGVHSLVDTGNELLLLYGLRRAALAPDTSHPFGYGRELYFWSFVVALLIFAVGAGISFYEGIQHLLDPRPITNGTVNYIVIVLSFLFEGFSWRIAQKELGRRKGRLSYLVAVRRSKNPVTFTVLFEDSAALLGLIVAVLGIFFSTSLHMPQLDGVASLIIGLILAATATFLARETKSLLIGEKASAEREAEFVRIAAADSAIASVNGMFTVHLGPDHIVLIISLKFAEGLSVTDIEESIRRIDNRLRSAHPELAMVAAMPESPGEWRRRAAALAMNTAQNRS